MSETVGDLSICELEILLARCIVQRTDSVVIHSVR